MTPPVCIVTGAAGQDGFYLTRRLLGEGAIVYAVVHRPADASTFGLEDAEAASRLRIVVAELTERNCISELIARTHPQELYNLGGPSSVAASFLAPQASWRANADAVADLLEALRLHSPETRFCQASSTDMFGALEGRSEPFTEETNPHPQSPYAAAKAAAHFLCSRYREAYGLNVASCILSNHESHRRGQGFLTRKLVEHVRGLEENIEVAPLVVGNVLISRDWGFAPQYVEGLSCVIRQVEVRAANGNGGAGDAYRDYVLSTGRSTAVWELIDQTFRLGGFELEWELDLDDPSACRAHFRRGGRLAVTVDPKFFRPRDARVIKVDPSRARRELGWVADAGPEVFLADMLAHEPSAVSR